MATATVRALVCGLVISSVSAGAVACGATDRGGDGLRASGSAGAACPVDDVASPRSSKRRRVRRDVSGEMAAAS